MAGGGSVQLTLSGGQDKYLHFSATSGFFDSQHISYEDFAIESIAVDSQGNMNFGRTARYKFTGAAELAAGAYLETILPELIAPTSTVDLEYNIAWVHCVGLYLFQGIEFSINNTRVDIHYPQFLDLWARLTIPNSKRAGYNDMIGEINFNTRFAHNHQVHPNQVDAESLQHYAATKPQTKVILPLRFWWCEDYSQALPVGLLLFSDIYVNVQYEEASKLYLIYATQLTGPTDDIAVVNLPITRPSIVEAKLYVDYVYLSEFSRERLANKAIFYVIKQVRTPGPVPVSAPSVNYRLPFVMPVTTLIYGVQEDGAIADDVRRYDWWDRYKGNHNYLVDDAGTAAPIDETTFPTQLPDSPVDVGTLKILSTERFTPRDWMYWNRYVPFKSNTRTPDSRGVFCYHFALYPEQHLASGAINLSHSDNNFLYLTFNRSAAKDGFTTDCGIGSPGVSGTLYIYAINHNYVYMDGGYITVLYNV